MDRDRIERRDFPTGRRGYDPAAVDEHLRRVADAFEAHVRGPRPSLADSTSEQIRQILDAAERGAREMRARAGEEASDHVARVQAAAGGMLSRLDALEAELDRLLTALRAGGQLLTEGLEQLQAEIAAARSDDVPPDAARRAGLPLAGDGAPARNGSAASEIDPGPRIGTLEEELAAASEPADAGARLTALNMALGGSPREETARFLAEHFELDDPGALLDDVYTRAGR